MPLTCARRPCMRLRCTGAAAFRRAGLFDVHVGPGTRLRVAAKQPESVHEIQFGKLEEWLQGGARSPNESVTKGRLREVLGKFNG